MFKIKFKLNTKKKKAPKHVGLQNKIIDYFSIIRTCTYVSQEGCLLVPQNQI